MKLKLLMILTLVLSGCAGSGFKGSATVTHEASGASVTLGYDK